MLLKLFIRNRFRLTSRLRATQTIEDETTKSLQIANAIGEIDCRQQERVPKMIGIDEDMRYWSVYQTLQHNCIVNRSIQSIVQSLAAEAPYHTDFDPKTDVMPGVAPGDEQLQAFQNTVDDYLNSLKEIPSLRSKTRYPHPLFGPFNAHQWHCMFGFHLGIHNRQLKALHKQLS